MGPPQTESPPPSRLEDTILPEALKTAMSTANPQKVFEEASKHYTPFVLAMLTSPPYSGGSLIGFFVPNGPGEHIMLNAFLATYFDPNLPTLQSKYFDAKALTQVRFSAFHQSLSDLVEHVRSHEDLVSQS